MKRSSLCLAFFIVAVLLGSCGLYLQQQARARQEKIRVELDQALRDIEIGVRRGLYPNSVTALKEFDRSVRAISARYGQPLNVFDELLLSYLVALAGRYDRREISQEEFVYLVNKMNADIKLEQARLALQLQAIQAQRDLQWELAMREFWANYRQSLRNPIFCQTMNLGGGFSTIHCY